MGELIVNGTLDLTQFWPAGESDADTAKIIVEVAPGAIRYRPDGGKLKATNVYDRAFVKTFGKREPVIKDRKLTVRLQGIDAPELHLQPQSMNKTVFKGHELGSLKGSGLVKRYRQHQAETATARLCSYLRTLGASPLPCRFVSHVIDAEGPGDVIDKYGRFVGDIFVGRTRKMNIDVNLEILRRGWAVIALYNSMQRDEIGDCLKAWKAGIHAKDPIVQYMTGVIGAFDPGLLYRRGKNVQVQPEGAKKFIHPKLYRRQCTWWAYHTKGTFSSGFDTFLQMAKDDVFYELDAFLRDAAYVAVQIPLADMVKNGKKVIRGADEVVFKEAPSTLYDAKGKKLVAWP